MVFGFIAKYIKKVGVNSKERERIENERNKEIADIEKTRIQKEMSEEIKSLEKKDSNA